MKALEKYYAKKNMAQIKAALNSPRMIADLAKALDIDLNDPEWSNMPFTEASQVMQVRVADRVRRYNQLMKGKQK
jgi:hypothetical protein